VVGVDPRVPRKARVGGEHAELAVDGHDVSRAEDGENRPQLFGMSVAGDVHRRDLLVEDLRAGLGKAVDRVVDAELIPRHGLGGDDDGVALLNTHVLVVVVRHACERRHGLALAPRAKDHRLVRAQLREHVWLDEELLGHVDIAEVPRDVDVLAERTADQADLAPVLDRHVDRLLNAVDVGGEGSDEDPSVPLRDDLTEDLSDGALRLRHSRALGVRGVAE
jgi:hypothetical protein